MALVAAAFMFLGAGSAVAMDPVGPWFHVMVPSGHIGGGNWSPGTLVGIDVDVDGNAVADYHVTVLSSETGWIDADLTDWAADGMAPGQQVTVSDGLASEMHDLRDPQISGFNLLTDEVYGNASHPTTLQVEAHRWFSEEMSTRIVSTNGAGAWTADFSIAQDLQPVFDLAEGVHLDAIALDDGLNGTQVCYEIMRPNLNVDANVDEVFGGGWPEGAAATLTVDAPDPAPDFVQGFITQPDGTFGFNLGQFDPENPFDIVQGMTVTLECGAYIHTHEVAPLFVGGVDPASDVVTGTGLVNSEVVVEIMVEAGDTPRRRATADAVTGEWSVSFAETDTTNPNPDDASRNPYDIVKGTDGQAVWIDADGDRTRAMWSVPDTRFMVNSSEDRFMGNDWPVGAVTIEIDDFPYDGVAEFMMSAGVDGGGQFNAGTWDGPRDPDGNTFNIVPGQHITVTGGDTVKDTYVSNIMVSGVDPVTDVVVGTGAGPAGVVYGEVWDVPGSFRHEATADGVGDWAVDFSSEAGGENPFDLVWGTRGGVQQLDLDGDITEISWQGAVISASPNGDSIWGWGFYAGTQVTVDIDDPSNGDGIDATMQAGHDATGSFGCNTGDVGFDLMPGMLVTVGDGETTKTLTPIGFGVTSVNAAIDTLYGTAPPDTTFQVYVQDWTELGQPWREATSDSNGEWSVDFGIANLDEFVYDVRPGTNGWLSHRDTENDESQFFWNVPNPFIGVNHVNNNIWGEDWADGPGGEVTITVDDPANGTGVDHTFPAQIDQWNAGFRIDTTGLGESFDLTPGMVVDVVNGGRHKDTVVGNVSITAVDVDLDTVTGIAEPDRQVQVVGEPKDGQDSWPMRFVTADANGDWTVDFSVAVGDDEDGDDAMGWGRTLDVAKGSSGQATQWEDPDDGDHTQADWRVPNPMFGVNRADNNIWGSDFTGGQTVTIEIDDPATPLATVDYSTTALVEDGQFWADFGDYRISSEMTVTVTDGVNTKTHVVTGVLFSGADAASDVVTGTAAAGSEVQVLANIWSDDAQPMRFVTADVNGVWSADFSAVADDGDGLPEQGWGRAVDLQPNFDGQAQQNDEDGDHTQVRWWIPDPRISVNVKNDNLSGWSWPALAHVFVAVDSLNGQDVSFGADCDQNGWFDQWTGYDFEPGDIVTVTDGAFTRELIVSTVQVTATDAANDTITGTATPGREVEVQVWDDEGSWRATTADAEGQWSVDFGVAWGEQPAIDLLPGRDGEARESDADGDWTKADWHIANPRAWADPVHDIACAEEFLPSVTVTLTVDDLTTVESPDRTATQESDDGGWAYFEWFGDVNPDCVVTLTDGFTTRELDVANVDVTTIDIETESMAGMADPGATVEIWIDEGYMGATAVANELGEWTRVLGPPLDEVPLDLFPGLSGNVVQMEEDGDSTRVQWRIPNPKVEVSAVDDWLEGHDWDPGVEVLVTVDDPVGPDFVTTATANFDRYIGLWDTGYDVKSGQLVTFSDGSRTATHTVTNMLVTGWDEEQDTVWGTAEPGSWVSVEIWDAEEGIVRDDQADENGDWIVDFTEAVGPEPWNQPFDITKGTDGRARQYDEEGDATAFDFHVLNPRFTASPAENVVWGSDWTPNVPMTVTVDATGTAPDAVYTTISSETGDMGFGEPGPPMGPVNAGDTITVTDGTTTKVHVVTTLEITDIDRTTGVISGLADPAINLFGWRHEVGGGQIGVNPDGTWTAVFTPPEDPALPSGASGEFEQPDPDGDVTHAFWRIPLCETYADPKRDVVFGNDWTPGVQVRVTVNDVETPADPDFETTVTADGGGFEILLNGLFDVRSGSVVTASDGEIEKQHVVTALTVGGVDVDSDVITGTAEPGSFVSVRIDSNDGGMFEIQRNAWPDAEGNWSVDVSVQATDIGLPEGRTTDLQLGDTGRALQPDVDDDYTSVSWIALAPLEAVPDDYAATEDTTLAVTTPGVLTNDAYATPDVEVVTDVQHGTLALAVNGGFVYRPSDDFSGQDAFYYRINQGVGSNVATVTITVNGVNDAPVASDITTSTAEDTAKTIDAAASATDVDGDALTLTGVTDGAHGTVAIVAGKAVYTPATNWFGGDSFTYTVSDGNGGTDTATVNVTVNGVNDAPVASDITTSTAEDTAKTVTVLGFVSDVDGPSVTLSAVTQGAHGTVAIVGDTALYTPQAGWSGTDSFTYTASDGTLTDTGVVTITVIAAGDRTPPVTTAAGVLAGWVSSDVTVMLAATDTGGSGVSSITHWIGAGASTTVPGETAVVPVASEGANVVSFRATDASGNVEATKTATVRIDKTAPDAPSALTYSTLTTSSVTLAWPAATDALSGVAVYEVLDDAAVVTTLTGMTTQVAGLVPGTSHVFGVRAIDAAGNRSLVRTLIVTLPEEADSEVIPPGESSTVTLTVPATGPSGASVLGTLTVTITGVEETGTLTIVRSENPPSPPPATFKFVDDYFDIDFTGSFAGTLTITLPYDPRIPDARAQNLTLKHWKDNGWETVPTTVDLVNHTITAELTSLSPVAIAEPETAVSAARMVPSAVIAFPAYGASAPFTVRLVTNDANATALSGFTLTIQRAVGGAWSSFATATPVAGSPGTYRFYAKPYAGLRTVFRVRLSGNPLYTSSDKLLYVVPKAKLGRPYASTSYPRAYRTFYLKGAIAPKGVTSAKVEVYKYSSTKRRYVRITTKSVRVYSGAYRLSLRLSKGTYRFRTYVGANLSTSQVARTYSSYSATVRVR